MASFSRWLSLGLVAAALARPGDEEPAVCRAGECLEPRQEGLDAAAQAEEEEDVGFSHVLLLQTGLRVGGKPAANDTAVPKSMASQDKSPPGMATLAALARAGELERPAAGVLCGVNGSGANITKEVQVPGSWSGVLVLNGATVHVTTQSGPSITLSGFENLMSRLNMQVLSLGALGTLVVDVLPNTCNSNLAVTLAVPSPLTHAHATSGSALMLDTMAGSLSATTFASISIGTLSADFPVSIDVSGGASVSVAGGHASFLSASASATGTASLGALTADASSLSVSSYGSIRNLTVQMATLSASSGGVLQVEVLQSAGFSCSSGASVNITGPGHITTWSLYGCAGGTA